MRRFTLALALIAALGVVPSAAAWTWPLSGEVLRPYSLGPDAYAAGQHRGVDVAGASGEPVRAPAAGAVSFAGVVPGSGRTVTIQLDGYAVSVTHLGEISVVKGATVVEGSTVGVAGQSGEVEWPTPYVHLGIRVSAAADGYVDPTTLLPPRAVAPPPAAVAPVAVPVAAPVAAPLVLPVAVPVAAPVVVPVVAPVSAPGSVLPSTPILAPVRTSVTNQTPALTTVVPRREPVAVEAPTVAAAGQTTTTPGGVSIAARGESAAAPTVPQPLGGETRVTSRPVLQGEAGVAPPPAASLAVPASPSASSAPPVPSGGGAAIAAVQRVGRFAATSILASPPSDRSVPREAVTIAAVPVDRAIPADIGQPVDGQKKSHQALPAIVDEGSTTVGAPRLLDLGRQLAIAAAAVLLIALATIWLLTRVGRRDDDEALHRDDVDLGRVLV